LRRKRLRASAPDTAHFDPETGRAEMDATEQREYVGRIFSPFSDEQRKKYLSSTSEGENEMPIDLDQELEPINPEDEKYTQMLANLQGNILKSHGRDFAAHIFLRFTGKTEEIRKWIADFTNRFVTSAFRQAQETKEYKLNRISGRAFGAVYITAEGYRKLGFALDDFNEPQGGGSPNTFFKDGMARGGAELNDPPANRWDEGFRGRKIHAMVLLADEDPARLEDVRKRVEKSLAGIAEIRTREDGSALRDGNNKPVEQFGYRDGISQPLYYKADVQEEKDKFGIDQWDPSAPLNIVLTQDPLTNAPDSFGSYFVFRKLEENVKGFKAMEEKLAESLNLPSEDENKGEHERAGALVIGRFENGVPVLLSKTEDADALRDVNNFNYGADSSGLKCPFQGHIRKTNPRGDTGFEGGKVNEAERRRRITRRGITYGKRRMGPDHKPTLEDRPSKNVGLLFMCCQSSIPDQFGFMQVQWVNNHQFARPLVQPGPPADTGQDPVIGQGPRSAQHWPTTWEGAELKDFDFAGFVTLKGGEYFFAPSIPFLRSLDGELPSVASDQMEFKVEGVTTG
jgi:Dyp-type peroxidase family